MASSSSSHKEGWDREAFSGIEPTHMWRGFSESTRLYDVFINHRGPDVKSTLALQLYKSLEKLNITVYLDSEEKELGVSFTSAIETAIRSAAVHIAIFSKGYAESPWCLAELALMLQTKAKIIPVFYDVEPSALRHIEKGVYGKAFIQYRDKSRYMEKLKEWNEVLQAVSFIAGEKFNGFSDCESIISAVQKEVEKKRLLYVAKYPVGLPMLVEQFQNQCGMSKHVEEGKSMIVEQFQNQCADGVIQDFENQCGMSKHVEEGKSMIVGIFGMGGAGKTTLSKEIFNRKRSIYSRSCFLFYVREASVKHNLPSLQTLLLRELFDVKVPSSFTSVDDGKSRLSSHIKRSRQNSKLRFLIVVDDIDHVEQLDALLISDILDKFVNSLVLVTTRDAGVLISAGITAGYHLKGLDTYMAKELFCWHAFRQPYPSGGWEKLVDLFVEVCGGLPLSLKVLGSHVHGRDATFWELELNKVKKTLPQDIVKSLRISIDILDKEEKQIFMDVACFFIGELTKNAIKVWEASGWSSEHALARLKGKCLLEEIKDSKFSRDSFQDSMEENTVLRMHDHLRDMGREMADELNHPRRMWRSHHLQSLESKGLQCILSQPNIRCLHTFIDRSLGWHVKYFLGKIGNPLEPSTDLLWLELELEDRHQQVTDIPPWIPLQNLQRLRISHKKFGVGLKELWRTDLQKPFALKELVINKILELQELSLGFLGCLETLDIYDCKHLKRVTGISDLIKLVLLNITECFQLEFGTLSFHKLRSAKVIKIPGCRRLGSVTGLSDLEMLEELNIDKCEKLEFEESSLHHRHRLKKVTIWDCKNLKSMAGISQHTELVELKISDCEKVEELSLSLLRCLEKLLIRNCEHLKSVTGLSDLTKLMELDISYCWALELENLCLGRLYCLQIIRVRGCKYLKSMTGLCELQKLLRFDISHCEKLEELSFGQLGSLERIAINDCGHLKSDIAISDLAKLQSMHINSCGKIEELSLVRLSSLRLCSVSDVPALKRIQMKGCQALQSVDGIFWNLVKLNICDCPRLERVADIHKLYSLGKMQLFYCSRITIHNCIVDLQKPPSEFITIIGRAVDGAESSLDSNLFCDFVNSNSVVQNGMENAWNHLGRHVVGAIILCAVVVVNTSAAARTMNEFMRECDWSPWLKFEGRPGKWIITSVTRREDEIKSYLINDGSCFPFDCLDSLEDISMKKVTMPVMRGELNKILDVLTRIVNKMYR